MQIYLKVGTTRFSSLHWSKHAKDCGLNYLQPKLMHSYYLNSISPECSQHFIFYNNSNLYNMAIFFSIILHCPFSWVSWEMTQLLPSSWYFIYLIRTLYYHLQLWILGRYFCRMNKFSSKMQYNMKIPK